MSTKDTLNELVQRVGLHKAVKLLAVKGVGQVTFQKIASGQIKPSRRVVGRAPIANKTAEQQNQLQKNKEIAKRLGYAKVEKRTGKKIPTNKSSLKEIQEFNRQFNDRQLSMPGIHRMTGLNQKFITRTTRNEFIDRSTIRYEDHRIVARNARGERMFLVYIVIPKKVNGRTTATKEWYWATEAHLDRYKKFKAGEAEALYDVWEYEGVELHEFVADAQERRFVA